MSKFRTFKLDFIGIGAAKCATTWVYRCLLEHPQICGPYIKELNYYLTKKHPLQSEQEFERTRKLFKSDLISYLEYFSYCPADSIKGEISVSYIVDPGSAKKIHDDFPDVKILVILRDPVERAYSLYWFAREFLKNESNLTFEEALKNNPGPYINGGMYYKQLKPYFDHFPKHNIGVFFVEDLKKDPVKFIQGIYEFMGADKNFIAPSVIRKENLASRVRFNFLRKTIDFLVSFLYGLKFPILIDFFKEIGAQKAVHYFNYKINITRISKPKIKPGTHTELKRVFRDDVENLEKLLDRNLFHWK